MRNIQNTSIFWLAVSLAVSICSVAALAQVTPKLPPRAVRIAPPVPPEARPVPALDGRTSEKYIKVDSSVNLSLCVRQGNIKINGSSRSELRVFIQDGSKVGFKVLENSPKTGDPVWVMVTSADPKNKNVSLGECVTGDEIEIDLPANATVNVKGREISTRIDSVRKATVVSIGGDIALSHIAEGISASAGQGDITIGESKGAMALESTTGNIVVYDAGPSEIGDIFKAKTNGGAISLQSVTHRQVDAGSISGSLVFAGSLMSGGSYNLNTTNGSIRLSLPADSSFRVSANYGFGRFDSQLPIEMQTENIGEGDVKFIVGILGKGDATLKLTTNNGSISIKKQ